ASWIMRSNRLFTLFSMEFITKFSTDGGFVGLLKSSTTVYPRPQNLASEIWVLPHHPLSGQSKRNHVVPAGTTRLAAAAREYCHILPAIRAEPRYRRALARHFEGKLGQHRAVLHVEGAQFCIERRRHEEEP